MNNRLISYITVKMQLTQIIADPKNYPYIRHQKEEHGNIPFGVMMKAGSDVEFIGQSKKIKECSKKVAE